MVETLVLGYLVGSIVTTLMAYAGARRFGDRRAPSAHPLVFSIVAGAVWPLLVVGLVELSSVMVCVKLHSKPEPELGFFA